MFPTFSKNFADDGGSGAPSGVAKRDVGGAAQEKSASGTRTDIRYIIAIILFVLSLAATGAAYGANVYFDREIAAIEERLVQQDSVIKTDVIASLVSFDQSVDIFKEVELSRSGYVPIMGEISKLVVPGVRFSSAQVELEGNGAYRVMINGVASSLIAYLQQVDVIVSSSRDAFRVRIEKYSVRKEEGGNSVVLFTLGVDVSADDIGAIAAEI